MPAPIDISEFTNDMEPIAERVRTEADTRDRLIRSLAIAAEKAADLDDRGTAIFTEDSDPVAMGIFWRWILSESDVELDARVERSPDQIVESAMYVETR